MRIVCILASVALFETGDVGAQEVKKDQPKKIQTKTATGNVGGYYGYNRYNAGANVPNYPTDILTRYFELSGEQQKKNTALRTEMWQERTRRVKEVDAKLKEEFGDRALTVLNEDQKREYLQIQEIMRTYTKDQDAAQAIYFKTYEQLFEQKASHVPWNAEGIPATMPTLSQEEKQAVARASMLVRRNSYTKMNEALKAAGIERPKGRDIEAWKKYNQAAAGKRQELMAEMEPIVEEAIIEALPADMKPLFKSLVDAKRQSKELQTAAVEKYNADLEKVIGAERAKRKTYRNWGGQRTQRIQTQRGQGGAAVKKVLKEI
jgi:hypothetical protein